MRVPRFTATFDQGAAAFDVPELELLDGQMYWLVGPNGSGKTTLLRNLLIEVEKGAGATLLDQHFSDLIFPYHSVWWNIAAVSLIRGEAASCARREAIEMLSRFHLAIEPDQTAAKLSGGEQHIIVILRVVLTKPAILLLDEPTAALDAANAPAFWKVIAELRAGGAAVLVASHDHPPSDVILHRVELSGVKNRRMALLQLGSQE